jgi:aerobic-type carbon monoxide dehydrogenase small subunit (CoxS/CutS family)
VSQHTVRLEVNGRSFEATVPAHSVLIDFLRNELQLTGTKDGCGVGVCGACTVIVDGNPRSACLQLVVLLDGSAIRTVEGLSEGAADLTALQEAFVRHGGFQCGICTPGQLMAATALLDMIVQPTRAEIREWMEGNLCRCTGYYGIVEAIHAVGANDGGVMADGTPRG